MTALINLPRAAWKRQPQGVVEVNQTWRPFRCSMPGCYLIDQVTKTKFSGVPVYKTLSDGIGATGASSTNYTPDQLLYPQSLPFSALAVFTVQSLASANQIICYESDGSGTTYDGFGTGYSNKREVHFGILSSVIAFVAESNQATGISVTSSQTVTENKIYVVISVVTGSDIYLYVNGVLDGSISSLSYTAKTPTFYRWCDCGHAASNRYWQGGLFLFSSFARALSIGEVESLSANPWQLFKPRPSRFYLIPSSGVAIPSLSSPFFTNRIPKVTLTF